MMAAENRENRKVLFDGENMKSSNGAPGYVSYLFYVSFPAVFNRDHGDS